MKQHSDRRARRIRLALLTSALGMSMVSALGVLLIPTISDAFGTTLEATQSVLTVNLFAGVACTPLVGRLGDGRHPKRTLLVVLGIVLLGSLVCAFAPTLPIMLTGRAMQGLGYALAPLCLALARRILEAEDARRAMARVALASMTGLGAGYILTGLLLGAGGFTAAFLSSAVLAAASIVLVWAYVPEPRVVSRTARPDVLGSILLTGSLAAALLAITALRGHAVVGWILFGTAAALLVALALVERWTADPIVDLGTLRHRDVVVTHLTAAAMGCLMMMVLSSVGILLLVPAGRTPALVGALMMIPFSLGSLASGRVRAWAHARGLASVLVGAFLLAVGALVLAVAPSAWWTTPVTMGMCGLGLGVAYATMPELIAERVPASGLGRALALNQVLRSLGGAVGSAVFAALLAGAPGSAYDGARDAAAITALCGAALLCALVAERLVPRR